VRISPLMCALQAKEKGQLADDLTSSQTEASRLAEERAQVAEELGTTKGQLAAREVRGRGGAGLSSAGARVCLNVHVHKCVHVHV